MDLDFSNAIQSGGAEDLVDTTKDSAEVDIPFSEDPRGLAMQSLRVDTSWQRLRQLFGQTDDIYFLSVAFDLSDKPPVVLPPKEVSTDALYKVAPGETIEFSLGNGAPLFTPRPIKGGLVVYITVCEADRGPQRVGEVMAQVHEDLSKDNSLVDAIQRFVTNPGKSFVDEGLSAFTAALQPIATVLKSNKDDYVALFSGVYPAAGPWDGLTATRNGATLVLRELPARPA